MNGYYETLRRLKELLMEDPDINTVTRGDISKVDLDKKNIFPLAHISIKTARFKGAGVIVFPVSILALDLRDVTNEEGDKFTGGDNEDDNLNSMLYVLHKAYERITMLGDDFDIKGVPNLEAFTEDRVNLLDGWAMNFELEIPSKQLIVTNISDCD